MNSPERWFTMLQTELTRELGQPVRVATTGEPVIAQEPAEQVLALPEARLTLRVDLREMTTLLAEARLIDASQTDAETVRELWSGILENIATRLGGSCETVTGTSRSPAVCASIRLGEAAAALSITVENAPAAEKSHEMVVPERITERVTERITQGNYDLLLEVELEAMVRFGSKEMDLGAVMELGPGDVVELDRHVADPVDLIVGDKIVARGEVVLINGNFGLRVTEVAEPMRRLESIRCLW